MLQFLGDLRQRNEPLFYFSTVLAWISVIFFLLTKLTAIQVAGINAWFKPFKFAISIAIYCATMAWFCHDLHHFNIYFFNWANIGLFSFELIYIAVQAARAQESHFNLSTPFYRMMFGGMAIAAIAITLLGVYAGVAFFSDALEQEPDYYIWAIRLSIIIFIIFSFQGIMMGGRQTHTVGHNRQNTFLPFLKWNMKEGDLRVAHFIGMHALQVIPLLSWYLLKNTILVFAVSTLYLLFAVFVLMQALRSKPFIKLKSTHHEITV